MERKATSVTTTVATLTALAIDRLKTYLQTNNLGSAKIEQTSEMVTIGFYEPCVIPTAAQIRDIKRIFFGWFTDEELDGIVTGLIHYYDLTKTMLINIKFYDLICQVSEMINGYNMHVFKFNINDSYFSIDYTLQGNRPIDYEKLCEIRAVVNPAGDKPRAVIVFGEHFGYSMKIAP